ncbi:hypothetical protein ACFSJY_05025 [Thalassotalea euphylliae]
MKEVIQQLVNQFNSAAHESEETQVCNYADNYYGDQLCKSSAAEN